MKNIKVILFDLDNTLFLNDSSKISKPKLILEEIKKMGYKTGIVTNSNFDDAMKKISVLGISEYMDLLLTPGRFKKKPMRDMFLLATKKFGVNPSEILFVGDHLINDILGANFCGMKTVLVKDELRWYHRLLIKFTLVWRFFGPNFLVSDLKILLRILRSEPSLKQKLYY